MHMVGHHHIGMDGAAELAGELLQIMQIELKILFSIKTYRAVIATLDDVSRDTGNGKACATRHGD